MTAHFEQRAPWRAQVELTPASTRTPLWLEPTGATYDVAQVVSAQVSSSEAVEAGVGRSIRCIAELPRATVLVTGVGDPASRCSWTGSGPSHRVRGQRHLGVI